MPGTLSCLAFGSQRRNGQATRALTVFAMMLWCQGSLAEDIGGIWKNEADPVWTEVVLDDGVATGTVVRTGAFPLVRHSARGWQR
jgi:hypothetical protein